MKPLLCCILVVLVWMDCTLAASDGEVRPPWAKQSWDWRYQRNVARHEKRASDSSAPLNSTQFICQNPAPEITTPKDNAWAPLTDAELSSILSWLFHREDLKLTGLSTASANNGSPPGLDNTIVLVELLQPNKSDVLSYLDGKGAAPPRYAHVILNNRTSDKPVIQEIIVGPLPIDNTTANWRPLEYPFTKKNKGKIRNLDADMDRLYSDWVYPIGDSIRNITLNLWNATTGSDPRNGLFTLGINPYWQDDGRVKRWDTFLRKSGDEFNDGTLLPLGLYFKSDITGRDIKKWKLEGWFYNNVWYSSTGEFQKAYWAPGFEKVRGGSEGAWAHTDRQGEPLPRDTAPPPVASASSPPRFSVDVKKDYVEWMGFSFYMGFTADTGLSLYDIRYDGQRILYELGLQETLSHYAGNDPLYSSNAYLDSYYGFGRSVFELVAGFDCPQYATYLNSSFYTSETTHVHPNSICLFEFDESYPLQRHTFKNYVSITKNTQFVIRWVATLGNYDYTFSYTFALDGSIAVDARASGYIQAAFGKHNEDYGFQIHEALSGAIHDHIFNFKADFDILGTENSIQTVSNVPVSKTYPWSGGKARNTMKLERKFIKNEDDSRLNWSPNGATQVIIVNQDVKNRHGEYRGWRILPSTPGIHLTALDSTNLAHSAHWAEHDLSITRRKDTEPRSSNPYQNQDVHDPPVNFNKFFDSESLNQTDLVVWINLGMHHVPTTGDLPNTVMTTAHAGVKFVPSNYFDMDASRRSRNIVRAVYTNGAVTAVEKSDRAQVCEADFWNYRGDLVVQENPFDPNSSFYQTDAGIPEP